MDSIVGDPNVLKKMGENAYRHVKKHFQFDSYYEKVERIMELQRREKGR